MLRPLLALALLAALPCLAAAQPAPGAVDVVARGAETGAPIPFALVRLLAAPRPGAPDSVLRQGITGPAGRLAFRDVPAGDYRLQLARIGFRPVVSPVVHVDAGGTVAHELRGATQVVELAPVTVASDDRCLAGDRLAESPRVATLWEQARDGVELRRAFERQYRFVRERRQAIETRRLIGGTARAQRADTLRSEPDSVLARERRLLAEHRERGWAATERGTGRTLLALPEETELLAPEFLRDHCLEAQVAATDGALGVRFRPVAARGEASMRPGGLVREGRVAVTYVYRDVERVDGR